MNIEELAREAGFRLDVTSGSVNAHRLTRFASLVLEEAAKTAENTPTCLLPSGAFLSERCAAAIRALNAPVREATDALGQARAERDKLPHGEAKQAMNRALDRADVAVSKAANVQAQPASPPARQLP